MKRTIRTKASQDSVYADNTTMMQRVCIALLALVLCIGLMPSFAWAADEEDAAEADVDSQEVVVDEANSDEVEAVDIAVFAYDGDIDDSAEDEAIEDDDVEGDEVDANVPMFLADSGNDTTQSSDAAYDSDKAKTLLDNLTKRFSKGGTDASITNDTVYAALGLFMLGLGNQIDSDAILENLNSFEETNGYAPTAGVLAKYIMALTAADENCTKIEIDGVERDLVAEMDALISVDDMDIYSAVWILAAYCYGSYEQGNCDMSIEAIADFIMGSANDEGLFGGEYGYDAQTTAQAAYALILFADDAVDASLEYLRNGDEDGYQSAQDYAANIYGVIFNAEAGMESLQNSDGGIGYSSEYPESDIDTTANAAVVFQAMGMDPTDASLFIRSDVPIMEYLVEQADDDLNGYTESGTYNEPMTSSTALMALAAVDSDASFAKGLKARSASSSTSSGNTGNSATPTTVDLSTGSGLGNTGNTATTGTNNGTSATPSSGSGYTSPTSSTGNNGSSLAKTGDDSMTVAATTGIVALCALIVALIAARRLRHPSTY